MSTDGKDRKKPSPKSVKRVARWQKVLVAAAGVFVVVGLALSFMGPEPRPSQAPAGGATASTSSVTPSSLVAGGTTTGPGGAGGAEAPAEQEGGLTAYSPFFVKSGFSFLAGFCIAYALRSFVKLSIVALGLMLMVAFALVYFDIITVDWAKIDGHFQSLAAGLKDELESMHAFVTGSLPSASAAGVGLFTGARRK